MDTNIYAVTTTTDFVDTFNYFLLILFDADKILYDTRVITHY